LESILDVGIQPRKPDPYSPERVSFVEEPEEAAVFADIRSTTSPRPGRGDPTVLYFPHDAITGDSRPQGRPYNPERETHRSIPPQSLTVHHGPKKTGRNLDDSSEYDEWINAMNEWKAQLNEMHGRGESEVSSVYEQRF
jgi:hypothetical protein